MQDLHTCDRAQAYAQLARAALGIVHQPDDAPVRLGAFTMLPHQLEAVHRLHTLIDRHGGALLADTVGLGKTLVALAVSARYVHVDVIAPAGLLRMWRDTVQRAAVAPPRTVVSLHRFSFASPPVAASLAKQRGTGAPHLVIIDEAHHLRNPATRRFSRIAEWCRGAHVLMLTATPVHNRVVDLVHVLSLYLGTRAQTLTHTELASHIVRRDAGELASVDALRPRMVAHPPFAITDDGAVARTIARLPPPVPTRGGRAAGALVALGLLRAWCSSGAACLSAVRRRRARAVALEQILAQDRWPTQQELRAWTITEDAVQLGFTELLVERADGPDPHGALSAARAQLTQHQRALELVESMIRERATALDRRRAELLRRLRREHGGVAIVAFTQFAETVYALGRVLRWDVGVATLTARGGRVAGGSMSRHELLRRVAPHAHGATSPPAHERIYLLITTDLLAEGVNLQDAVAVVHVDLPWTPASIAQREGRIARLGSQHRKVHTYSIQSPGDSDAIVRIAQTLRKKARASALVLAPGTSAPRHHRVVAMPTALSPMQTVLRRWIAEANESGAVVREAHVRADEPMLCVVQWRRAGWLAALSDRMTGGWFDAQRTRVSHDARTLSALVRAADASSVHGTPSADRVRLCVRAVERALRSASRHARTARVVDTLQSPVHRAQRQIRQLIAAAPLGQRLQLAPLAERASRSLRGLRGAGDELALRSLLEQPQVERPAAEWLREVIALGEERMVGVMEHSPTANSLNGSYTVHALVLLLP